MARKVTTTTVETASANDESSREIDIDADEEETELEKDTISELLELGQGEVRWKVDRISPADKAGHCTTYITGDLSLDRIREEWGGGKFKITGIGPDGKYVARRTVAIVEPVKHPMLMQPQNNVAEIMAIVNSSRNDSSTMMMQMMKSQSDLLAAVLSRPQPVGPDPTQMQTNMLAMMASMRDIFKPEKSTSDIELLMKGLELGREFGGGGGSGDTGWMDLLVSGMGMAKPLIQKAMEAPATIPTPIAPRQRVIATTVPDAPNSPPVVENPVKSEENPMLHLLSWLQRQIKALLVQAARDKDPELYAEVFLDNLPDDVTPELILKHFDDEKAIERLAAIDGGVLKYREWFESFRDSVIDMLAGSEDDDDVDEENVDEPQVVNGSVEPNVVLPVVES